MKKKEKFVRASKASVDKAIAAIDWAALEAKSDAEVRAAIAGDPDTVDIITLPSDGWTGSWPLPDLQELRNRLGLSQKAFSQRFGIPKRSLENWEQGRRRGDAAANAYLHLIAAHPKEIAAMVAEVRAKLLAGIADPIKQAAE